MSVFSIPVHADNVLLAQELLTKLGYTPGPIDGSYGAKTKYALENFYASQNKKFDGELSSNEITSLKKSMQNSNFSFEALKMMDDHVAQSELLTVSLPKSNLVIKDYKRFRDYRLNHYKNNYSFTNWLWKEKGSSGKILDKSYCYETLAKFLIPSTPVDSFKGRSETDFTHCQNSFLTFGVMDFNASFKMYQKLFLEMATSEKDHWVYRRSNVKNSNPTFYHLGGVIATFYMYYAVNYEAFNYTQKQRNIIENYFKKKAFAERFNLDGDGRTSLCPIKKPMSLNKRVHITNNCGSVRLRFAAGELALAIVTQDEALWKKALWDLDYALSMTNDEGFFVPLSAKGCKALGYTYDTSRLFSLNVEILKLAGYNLLDYKTRHGKTISEAYEMLFKQYEDITISNHIAKKAIGADSCGKKPFKTHNEFLIQEFGTLDDGTLNAEWVPGFGRFINWSIRFTSEKHPEWIKASSLRKVETDPFIGNYHTLTAFEIYNANVMSEPKSIWKSKFNRQKEVLRKKEEDRKDKEADFRKLKEEKSKVIELSKKPNFSFEALKMMDDHIKQSTLLKVPMPSSNLVIKDYKRFRDYRRTNYENNLSFSTDRKRWLWKEIKTSGNVLSKEYCYETLAKFLIPTAPNGINNGRTYQDFTDCQKSLHVFSLTNFDASFELYQKLFLEMATSKKDYWTYRRSNRKDMNPTFYHLGGVISTFYMYYAVNYEAFNYTKKERSIIENYFKKKAFAERFNLDGDGRTSLCPIKNPMNFNRRIHKLNNCGSVRLRFAAGELALAIATQDRALWEKGLWDLDFSLSMINDEGFFLPLSARGCKSLGYTYSTSKLFSLNIEMLKLAGFNLLNYNSRHGKTISQAYEMLFKQYEDITISNHIAKKSFGAASCGLKPYKTHNEFLAWEAGFGDPKLSVGVNRYKKAYDPNNNGDPDLADYTSWSIRFVSEEHPEWVKENLLKNIKTDFDSNNYFTVNPFEIYNANVMSEPKSIWLEREKIAKKQEAERKRIKEDERKKAKAERLRKREMVSSYNGTYKIHLGINHNVIDGKMYQDLGIILFTLNRGQPKLDENNILYQALGLSEIKFSLDYDGYMKVSGKFLGEINSERRCVYISGNLKSDKKFNPKSSQNCGAFGQSLSMRFDKISDDMNLDLVDEKELKKLDGEYDVQWFITGINSTDRTLRAKDTLTISNGIGVFSGNEPKRQPSSELRKKLLVQHNANGEIIILGKIDLMEKMDVKKWYASGKIQPNKKTTIKTVWGFGDIIELEIEKSKVVEVSKAIEPETLIHGGDFIYDEKNNSYKLKSHDEITGINQIDFSLSINSDDVKLFNGDIAYSTSANNFETTWIDLKVKGTDKISQNIKIGFVIEERSFPNFAEPFSISKNECGIFEDMADDSFIIPLKTDNLIELELFDCHSRVLQKNLNNYDFEILKDRIDTAISLVENLNLPEVYFVAPM